VPAPGDVQATNNGATSGEMEPGDEIVFTFAAPVDPSLILAGWTGAATTVTVRVDHSGASTALSVKDSGGIDVTALGSVELDANYADNVSFAGSTMTASGSTITVTIGVPGSNAIHQIPLPTTMIWTAPTGIATESGLPDAEF
jgi:chitinase